MHRTTTITLLLLCLLAGCSRHEGLNEENAAYYWRTEWRLDSTEQAFLAQHDIRKIYLRYFDVVMENGEPTPNATLTFAQPVTRRQKIVPTVYITEDCMHHHWPALAHRLVERISQMNETNGVAGVDELQIDCDYTSRSRTIYYRFLDSVRQEARHHGMHLSTTIRLHQLQMPAPSADYGVLMLYNTGDPRRFTERNPVLDLRDVRPYLRHLANYPLPLAAAYPVYCWQRQIYGVRIDHVVGANELLSVKEAVEQKRPSLAGTIIVYHLDKENIIRYSSETYEEIFRHH